MNIKNIGTIVIDRTFDDEWGKVVVDEKLRRHIFDVLELDKYGYKIPDYEAHISLFDKYETQVLPLYISEEGKYIDFELSECKFVQPADWDGVKSCFIVCVDNPLFSKIRKKYGFSPLMHKDHPFHITIGISDKTETKELKSLVSVFNEFVKQGL